MKTLIFVVFGVIVFSMGLQLYINKKKIRKLEHENQQLEQATSWQRDRIEQLKNK